MVHGQCIRWKSPIYFASFGQTKSVLFIQNSTTNILKLIQKKHLNGNKGIIIIIYFKGLLCNISNWIILIIILILYIMESV